MESNLTAVEFIEDYLKFKGLIINDKTIPQVLVGIIQQAKEMEKQQMRSASCPYIGGWEDDEFEYWYNEKYKKNDK